ncbi:MAG TPA: prepilin-type N-terminal cleavage/methylation domain-containing protein [Armatimonadota bacterium]|nr:prepilin-type N-terminal cleavage/methylation domain-containing protein [Armatimonadota bacterium]
MPRKGFGFTLIELLVVIAMIAILAALMFPVFFMAIASAHRSACAHNLQEIAQGIEFNRQDSRTGYPGMPENIAENGIPDGGVTAIALSDPKGTENYFWCKDDRFPKDFPEDMWKTASNKQFNSVVRDSADSSYNFGYNYYGYVTTTEGLPFPVTDESAARYFFGNPKDVDQSFPSPDPGWNLGLVNNIDKNGSSNYRPAGLFQGLWNTWAPKNTIVTFCHHHLDGTGKGILPIVMLSGESMFIRPVKPTQNGKDIASTTGVLLERDPNNTGFPAGLRTTTDWRINKSPFKTGEEQKLKYFGDAPNQNVPNMPVVYVNKNIFFRAEDLAGSSWYDTHIQIEPHDAIMVIADAKWSYSASLNGLKNSSDPNEEAIYKKYRDRCGNLFFTASGNLTNKGDDLSGPCVLASDAPGALIGKIGGSVPFHFGARGFQISQDSGTLYLSMNDLPTGYNDNKGWCQVWVAIYRP